MDNLSQVLKLLGDRTRLTMVAIIHKRESCVCELVEVFQMSQPAISQHLRKLKDAGLVKEERRGQWIYYSLHSEHVLYPLVVDILQHVPDQAENIQKIVASNPTARCGC